jgi:hypothetical protein
MTGDYTVVQLKRQDQLTRAIQERIDEAWKKQQTTEALDQAGEAAKEDAA